MLLQVRRWVFECHELMVFWLAELAAHPKRVIFASHNFKKLFQVWPGMYQWLVFLATGLLAGTWLGHLVHGHGYLGLYNWPNCSYNWPNLLYVYACYDLLSLTFCDLSCSMDRLQTNRKLEWYMIVFIIQPQSNLLYHDGANYPDRHAFLNDDKPKGNQFKMKYE